MLDDEYTLSNLSVFNSHFSIDGLLRYLGASDTGPLGRPISVLSFLFDGLNWPTLAYPFKRTNLIIHVINSCLLYGVIYQCVHYRLNDKNKSALIAFFSAAFWAIHPFLVSTTLYVVQRMAMLPTLFILLALLLYVWQRIRIEKNIDNKSNILSLYFIVYGLTGLAVLSKENGLLLLPLIALFEVMLCQNFLHLKRLRTIHYRLLIQLPVLLFAVLFIWKIPDFLAGYYNREFIMGQRLLSETRALITYLWHFINPYYFTEGVFTDGFTVSKGLFNPISTLYALIGVCVLLILAWVLRKKYVLLSFALFFFFIAHIIESTIVPLELYYEHRNYLAFLFLPLPLAWSVSNLSKHRLFPFLLLTALLSYTAFQTHLRTDLWSNNLTLHELTVDKYPESIRAVQMTEIIYYRQNQHDKSLALLTEAAKHHRSIAIDASLLSVKCTIKDISDEDVKIFLSRINNYSIVKNDISILGYLINQLLSGDCARPNNLKYADQVIKAVDIALSSYAVMGRSFIDFSNARLLFEQGEFLRSKNAFIHYVNKYGLTKSYVKAVSQFLIAQRPTYALELAEAGLETVSSLNGRTGAQEDLIRFKKVAQEDINRKK